MFPPTHQIGFVEWSSRFLMSLPESPSFPLRDHQKVISKFLSDSPYRGLLLYHGLGSGKSCAAIAAAESIDRQHVFVMLPRSLRTNFENEINKCGKGLKSEIIYVHTNGIPVRFIDGTKIRNKSLDGSCVIIDEVHNLISQIVNGGRRGQALFSALSTAKDVKIIALSGTPIINTPYEIGVLLNMICGPEISLLFDKVRNDTSSIQNQLKSIKWIDKFSFEGKSLRVWLTPLPYSMNKQKKLVKDPEANTVSEQTLTKKIIEICNPEGEIKTERNWIYPKTQNEFNTTFLNRDLNKFVNRELFSRKALGKVSYFRMTETQRKQADYPTIVENSPIVLEMTESQFETYIEQRRSEIQMEIRLQELAKGRQNEVSLAVYRAFSRAVCNFAFGSNSSIKRYFPSSYRAMIKELDSPEKEIEEAADKQKLPTYSEMIESVLDTLRKNPDELRGQKLYDKSPKFATILKKVKSTTDKTLIYSQFRTLEGIGIMSLVLEANGFSKLKIESDKVFLNDVELTPENKKEDYPCYIVFDSSDKNNGTLIDIFNNELDNVGENIKKIVKKHDISPQILFISQSGAEGINLKKVQHVHICEPYWNEIRIQQVIGRAARDGSHKGMPEKKKRVDIYRYLMKIPENNENFTIRNVDKNLSTDQIVLANAKDKMTLVESFLDALRSSAIDCKENCFGYPKGLDPDDDYRNISISRNLKIAQRNNKKFLYDPDTGEEFDFDVYQKTGKVIRL